MLSITTHETPHGAISEIQLARPPVNALNLELLQQLYAAIESSHQGGARGIVLSGAPGMFSAGVDVPALLEMDRGDVENYWRTFFRACAALARSPVPVAAAITGHSPAGGAVLALHCDYRIMAQGAYRIGLNEVQVGMIVPEFIQLGLRRVVGQSRAERLLIAGTLLDAEQALACGFVDELVPPEQVVARATTWLGEMLALPPRAMLGTRAVARADLMANFADVDAMPIQGLVDAFFEEDTLNVLKQLVARLKKKA